MCNPTITVANQMLFYLILPYLTQCMPPPPPHPPPIPHSYVYCRISSSCVAYPAFRPVNRRSEIPTSSLGSVAQRSSLTFVSASPRRRSRRCRRSSSSRSSCRAGRPSGKCRRTSPKEARYQRWMTSVGGKQTVASPIFVALVPTKQCAVTADFAIRHLHR